jgi:hypothetical protein
LHNAFDNQASLTASPRSKTLSNSTMDRLPSAAELKQEYERYHADRANGVKSPKQYAEAGMERPWWNQGGIADNAELERLKGAPAPRKQTTVVVELDDVVRATASGVLEGLKLDGVGMEDLESRFLLQCKGFGTPTRTSVCDHPQLKSFPPNRTA